MAKLNKWERQHLKNLLSYEALIDEVYKTAAREAADICTSLSKFNPDKMFSFSDYPQTKRRVDTLLETLKNSLTTVIVNGVRSEWTLANNKNNELCNQVFGDNVGKLSKAAYKRYYSSNPDALEAFTKRKTAGLNLSDRVWNYTNQFKTEIEMGLDVGIRNGLSADEMSRQLRTFLKYPDKLFRRVRDEHNQLQLSKNAAAFHPGRGVYRSSYKNARRLAATESNIAYRTADYLRWQDLDFVVGILIEPSKTNHETDICDDLKGKYPKNFKWTGWHPHCRCHALTITKTQDEMAADTKRILNGEEPSQDSENSVTTMPKTFEKWVKKNGSRIIKANSLPYFVSDNAEAVSRIMQKVQPSTSIAKQMQKTVNFDDNVLYFKKTSDKVASLVKEYEEQTTDIGQAILVNQIKHECAALTNQELTARGQVGKDWVWARTEFDTIIQPKATYSVGNKIINIDEVKMNMLVYKDNVGREFAYPIGASKHLFKATEASSAIQELPPYLRHGIKKVSFLDIRCPSDDYWKVKYNNPRHRSMAIDGGKTTFFMTPQSVEDFKGYMTHEAGHIIDGNKRRFSASKGWKEACEKDEALHTYRVSNYAKTNDSENFAECIRAYINDHETFKKMFPNCAAYIRKMAQKLSSHFKTP